MNHERLTLHVGGDLEPVPPSLTKGIPVNSPLSFTPLIRVLRGQYSVAITDPYSIHYIISPFRKSHPNFLCCTSYADCFADFMAQKTEKEDAEFKVVPETIVLCAKCGVAYNSAAGNSCQKCFGPSSAAAPVKSPVGARLINHVYDEKSFRSTSSINFPPETDSNPVERSIDPKGEASAESQPPPVKREVNRCSGCRRKVGLTGFRCRCGELFCADHRYSDRHHCSYDYKESGREAIARENPVVKAAKIVKI